MIHPSLDRMVTDTTVMSVTILSFSLKVLVIFASHHSLLHAYDVVPGVVVVKALWAHFCVAHVTEPLKRPIAVARFTTPISTDMTLLEYDEAFFRVLTHWALSSCHCSWK